MIFTLGILISGLAGFLVISRVPQLRMPLEQMFNKLMKK